MPLDERGGPGEVLAQGHEGVLGVPVLALLAQADVGHESVAQALAADEKDDGEKESAVEAFSTWMGDTQAISSTQGRLTVCTFSTDDKSRVKVFRLGLDMAGKKSFSASKKSSTRT